MPEEFEEVSNKALIDEVVAGAEAHSAATKIFMSSFVFYDKTLSEWLNAMAVQIPDQVTPDDLRSLYIDVARKQQRAANYHAIASAIHGTLESSGDIKKSDLVAAIVQNYSNNNRKRPAATIIDRMADSYMKSTAHTKIAARIVKSFWRERKETLVEIRKCLEQIGIGMYSEMKYQE